MKRWLLILGLVFSLASAAYGISTLDEDKPANTDLISTYASYLRETRDKVNEIITGVTVGSWDYVTISFTATAGNRLLVDTSVAPATVTLPASPAQGDWVQLVDAKNTWGLNALTLDRNGSKINGNNADAVVVSSLPVTVVYLDSAYGWAMAVWTPSNPGDLGLITPARGYFTKVKNTSVTNSVVFTTSDGNFTGTGKVSVDKGGTNATTAVNALTNLGAEPTANKSNSSALGSSASLFPTQNATKVYVDTQVALKENTANKSNTSTLGTSSTLFPTQNATKVYVDTQVALKENLSNKSTNTGLGSSDTLYPTQKAVKTYVDSALTSNIADGFGMSISNNVSDANNDIDIASGGCADSTFLVYIPLTSGLTKRLDATWSAGSGNGGLRSGLSKSASTWYYVYVIRDITNGITDMMFDTNGTTPTLPSGYTAYRNRGAVLTNGSSNIIPFRQKDEWFFWLDAQQDVSGTAPSTKTSLTVHAPPIDGVVAHLIFGGSDSSPFTLYAGLTATTSGYPVIGSSGPYYVYSYSHIPVTSGQIAYWSTSAATTCYIGTTAFRYPLRRRF